MIPGTGVSAWSYSLSPNISGSALSALLESKMIIKVFPVLFPTHFLKPPCAKGEARQRAGSCRQHEEGKGEGFPQES